MTLLIVYGTVEGPTRKIAEFVQEKLRGAGHDVSEFDTAQRTAPVSFEGVDKVILAASVHERRHPQTFEVFVGAHRKDLAACETLLISVSMSAAFEEGLGEAREYLTEMEMRTEFKPDAELLVAGAIKTGSYDYFATQVIRHVVMRDREYDANHGEHEFTDWDALEKDVLAFANSKTGTKLEQGGATAT